MLIEMARSLRINTAGKTRDEVSQAIMDGVATKPLPAAPVQAQPASQPETSPAAEEAESVAAAPATEPNTQGSATQ